jgi:hypothetical protein
MVAEVTEALATTEYDPLRMLDSGKEFVIDIFGWTI